MDKLRDRLRDADPIIARAARVLRAESPHVASDLRKRRVRAQLRAGARALSPRPAWVKRIAWGFALVFLVTSAAAHRALITALAGVLRRPPAAAGPRPISPALVDDLPPGSGEPSSPVPEADPAPTRPPTRSHHASSPPETRAGSGATPSPRAQSDVRENMLLLDALRAGRQEHDGARALALVKDYLRAYPDGTLREEALGMAIEAAASLHSPEAHEFAIRYLRLFPHGRFSEAATNALQQPAAP